VCYSAPAALREASLESKVEIVLLSKTRQDECEQLRNKSIAGGVDCVFPIFWHKHTSVRLVYFSVFTGVRDKWCSKGPESLLIAIWASCTASAAIE